MGSEKTALRFSFNTFGNYGKAQAASERNDGFGDDRIVGVEAYIPHEALINF